MTDKVQKILSKIETRKLCTMDEHMAFYNDNAKEDYRLLSEIEELIKALQEEPVSNVLDEAAFDYAESCKYEGGEKLLCVEHFKAGANWQKEQMIKDAVECYIRRNRYTKKNVLNGFDVTCDAIQKFNNADKVKVIVIKED